MNTKKVIRLALISFAVTAFLLIAKLNNWY